MSKDENGCCFSLFSHIFLLFSFFSIATMNFFGKSNENGNIYYNKVPLYQIFFLIGSTCVHQFWALYPEFCHTAFALCYWNVA